MNKGDIMRLLSAWPAGLSISKAIVEALNGEISIHSVEGKGTTVSVFFPCRLRDKNKGL